MYFIGGLSGSGTRLIAQIIKDNNISKTKYFKDKITTENNKEILFWEHVNLNVKNFCVEIIPNNYLLVRYEDIANNYEEELLKILNFLGVKKYLRKFLYWIKLNYIKHNNTYKSSILKQFGYE